MIDIANDGSFLSDDPFIHPYDTSLRDKIVALCKSYCIESANDFGCGNCFYTKGLIDIGIDVNAVDGNPNTPEITGGLGKVAKLHLPMENIPKSRLTLCLEVGEHIPKEFEENFMYNLIDSSSFMIILSWAIPGQGGHGHVNEQKNSYIIGWMAQNGFRLSHRHTSELRAAADLDWFKNTLMVFVMDEIKVVMPSVYRPDNYLKETLESMYVNGDFNVNLTISVGNDDDKSVKNLNEAVNNLVERHHFLPDLNTTKINPLLWYLVYDKTPAIRFNANFINCLHEAEGLDFLYVEDDVKFTSRWIHKLMYYVYELDEKYAENYILTLYGPWDFRPGIEHEQIAPGHFYGTQAVYIKGKYHRGLVEKIMKDGITGYRHQADLLIDEYCRDNNVPIICLTTSLVQHIGKESTGLGNFHKTVNFRE